MLVELVEKPDVLQGGREGHSCDVLVELVSKLQELLVVVPTLSPRFLWRLVVRRSRRWMWAVSHFRYGDHIKKTWKRYNSRATKWEGREGECQS